MATPVTVQTACLEANWILYQVPNTNVYISQDQWGPPWIFGTYSDLLIGIGPRHTQVMTTAQDFPRTHIIPILDSALETLNAFMFNSLYAPSDVENVFKDPARYGADDRQNLVGYLTKKTAVETWRDTLVREHLRWICERRAAKTAKRQFKEANSDPSRSLCQKRLLREFTELVAN